MGGEDPDRAAIERALMAEGQRHLDPELARRVLDRHWGFEVDLEEVTRLSPGPPLPSRLRLAVGREGTSGRAHALLVPGARIRAGVRLSPIAGTRNPGAEDAARRARRRGLAVPVRAGLIRVASSLANLIASASAVSGFTTRLARMSELLRSNRSCGVAMRWTACRR